MNKTLTVIALAAFVSGCSSMQHASTFAATEQDLVAKAQYYEDLNRRHHLANIEAVAEIDAKFERAPAEAQRLLEEQGWSKAEYDTVISQVRADDELNRVFETAKVKAMEAHTTTVVAQQ